MQVDAAVQGVLGGVESPEVSSSLESDFAHYQHTTGVCWGGGLNKYQGFAGDALQPCIFKG